MYHSKNNKKQFNKKVPRTEGELKYTTKFLLKQIVLYALPFIIIDLLKSSYNLVDTLTVVRTLNNLGYSSEVANLTYSIISTWGNKLSMIIISISIGISTSLIPSLASDFVTKNEENINKKVNQAIQVLLFITIPMTFGIWFLARPIWIIFYSYDYLSIEIFKVFIFQALTYSLFSILLNITQTTNYTKTTILTLFISFIANAILNIPMMYLCHNLWHIGYQGASLSTLITQILPSIYLLYFIHKHLKVSYKKTVINCIKIIICTFIVIVFLKLLTYIYPINVINKIPAIIQTGIYSTIGILIYFITIYKSGVLKDIFKGNLIKKLKIKKSSV